MSLSYTLQRFLGATYGVATPDKPNQAVVERNHTEIDEYAAEVSKAWEELGTYACRFYWWEDASTGRGYSTEFASAQRTIDFAGGTLFLEPDVDVRPGDRVARMLDALGEELIPGPFRIVSLAFYPTQIECGLERP